MFVIEYRVALLTSQREGLEEKVKALMNPAQFFVCYDEARRQPRRRTVLPGDMSLQQQQQQQKLAASMGDGPSTLSDRWRAALTNASLALLGYMVLVHVWLWRRRRADKRDKRQQSLLHADSRMEAALGQEGGPLAATWEWQAAPERGVDDRSSELDEFYITTQDSDTSMNASMSGS